MAVGEREVKIPETLYKRIERIIEGTGFDSVSQFVTYVLREYIVNMDAQAAEAISEEDEEKVKERLKSLGYI